MAHSEDRPLPADLLTNELRALASELVARLGAVATVDCGEDAVAEGCTVEPAAAGAVSVWWAHFADEIFVGLGKAPGWELPRNEESVRNVRAIVEAAVRGDVEIGTGRGVTTYRVRTPDGVEREDAHEGLVGFLLSGPWPWRPRLRWASATPYEHGDTSVI